MKATPHDYPPSRAFTLLELLVMIGIVAVMAMTLLPALTDSRTKSLSVRCLSNQRQIMGAFLMYTHDNHDRFPPNPDDGTSLLGYTWCTGIAGVGGAQEFNPDVLADPRKCLITTYIHTNVDLFRCTADWRKGRYTGTDPTKIGTMVPAARTISLSQAVGTIDPAYNSGAGHSGVPNLPVNGPWLTGNYGANNSRTGPWRTYGKTSQMVIPIPAALFVVTEEAPLSLNDASLAFSVGTPEWIDYPSTLHNLGCVVGFADGHAELHKWRDPSLRLTAPPTIRPTQPTNPDWLWMAARTSAHF